MTSLASGVLGAEVMLKSAVPVLAVVAALSAFACSPARSAVPAGAHVEILQTQKLVLHGTAAPHPASASCASGAPTSTSRFLQLNEETTGNLMLRPIGREAVLHLQELATNRTWCVMTRPDGTGAVIPGTFPGGVYSIAVEGSRSEAAAPYEVVFERM